VRGDVDFTEADWAAIFPSEQPAPEPSSTALSLAASDTEITVGDSVTLTATVEPSTAEGEVVFSSTDDEFSEADDVENGEASVVVPNLAEGAHEFSAVFTPSDTDTFVGSTSNELTVTVLEDESQDPTEPVEPVE